MNDDSNDAFMKLTRSLLNSDLMVLTSVIEMALKEFRKQERMAERERCAKIAETHSDIQSGEPTRIAIARKIRSGE